jgi:acyl-CoA hydrolase
MRWRAGWRKKILSAEAAAALVPDGGFLYVSGNAASPMALLRALAARTDVHTPIRVCHVLLLGHDPFAAGRIEGSSPMFRHYAWFVGPADRAAVNDGDADYVPVHLHRIPDAMERGPCIDVAFLSASPPDAHGYMSLGVEVLASKAAIRLARKVVVQVNEAMPRVLGDSFLHVDDAHALVEASEPLPELSPPPPTPDQEAIAAHIAPLVPDGATMQLGIGGIPDAVLRLLQDRRDLGIHTEMISDGAMEAIERGVVTGRDKSLHTGKAIITFAMGSERLYRFLDDNPFVEAHPCEYVNDPFVIAQNDRMVAINSALSVDLTGQVCSDSIGTQIYSGFGGQVDFLRGAAASRGGVPVLALPSTAREGSVSRIVPLLAPGSGVVTTRADVHWIVTEHGAVNLFGRTLRERARLLLSIADPRFREALEAAARQRGLL